MLSQKTEKTRRKNALHLNETLMKLSIYISEVTYRSRLRSQVSVVQSSRPEAGTVSPSRGAKDNCLTFRQSEDRIPMHPAGSGVVGRNSYELRVGIAVGTQREAEWGCSELSSCGPVDVWEFTPPAAAAACTCTACVHCAIRGAPLSGSTEHLLNFVIGIIFSFFL